MSTYAIGDLHGCHAELLRLLDQINFDEGKDRLWFAGDLVNRGPDSLKTLRFIKALGPLAQSVLGNHDLHLLAIAAGACQPRTKDTLNAVIQATDAGELLGWLRMQPLMLHSAEHNAVLTHAGLPPAWTLAEARALAQETEALIRGERFSAFLGRMYGDRPERWSANLKHPARHRYIINGLTRMRYIRANGGLDMREKGPPGSQPATLTPWYAVTGRKTRGHRILFGHWSTVTLGKDKDFTKYNVQPLDTGCLWGGKLTALRLEDGQEFNVPSGRQNMTR